MVSLFLLLGCNLELYCWLVCCFAWACVSQHAHITKARIVGARALKTLWRNLKLYLNSLVYHRNIFGSSSEVFGHLRISSDIFGNFRKMFGNVRLVFGTILENLRKSSERGQKSSENHQKRRHQRVYIIKRTLHGGLKIWILCSSQRVMFFLLNKNTDDSVFDDFPKISDHFPKISEDFPK